MPSTRIKICGLTRVSDALVAADAGCDAVGLVFYPKSPRFIRDVSLANDIALAVGPFVSVVALFVNAARVDVERVLTHVPVDLIQFHGDEDDEACGQFGRPFVKALRINAGISAGEAIARYPSARGILLDTYVAGVPGGTGETFDWDLFPQHTDKALILAGGLSAANVQEAIARTRPYAVDVSGGVESGPGIKDHDKIREFIARVKS